MEENFLYVIRLLCLIMHGRTNAVSLSDKQLLDDDPDQSFSIPTSPVDYDYVSAGPSEDSSHHSLDLHRQRIMSQYDSINILPRATDLMPRSSRFLVGPGTPGILHGFYKVE